MSFQYLFRHQQASVQHPGGLRDGARLHVAEHCTSGKSMLQSTLTWCEGTGCKSMWLSMALVEEVWGVSQAAPAAAVKLGKNLLELFLHTTNVHTYRCRSSFGSHEPLHWMQWCCAKAEQSHPKFLCPQGEIFDYSTSTRASASQTLASSAGALQAQSIQTGCTLYPPYAHVTYAVDTSEEDCPPHCSVPQCRRFLSQIHAWFGACWRC